MFNAFTCNAVEFDFDACPVRLFQLTTCMLLISVPSALYLDHTKAPGRVEYMYF